MTYTDDERRRAAAWKASTSTLPEAAKVPAPYVGKTGTAGTTYDFCLPAEFAALNLLPEVRDQALDLFALEAIPGTPAWVPAPATTCCRRRCSASTRSPR